VVTYEILGTQESMELLPGAGFQPIVRVTFRTEDGDVASEVMPRATFDPEVMAAKIMSHAEKLHALRLK
jgi:hypothetical protein